MRNNENKIVGGIVVGVSFVLFGSWYYFGQGDTSSITQNPVPSMDFVADDRPLITPIGQDYLPIIKPVDIATVEDLPPLMEEEVESLPEIAFDDTLPTILPPLQDNIDLPPLQEV